MTFIDPHSPFSASEGLKAKVVTGGEMRVFVPLLPFHVLLCFNHYDFSIFNPFSLIYSLRE